MQIEDGLIWVYGVGEDGVQAFTDFGIENLEFVGLQGKAQAAHGLATGMIHEPAAYPARGLPAEAESTLSQRIALLDEKKADDGERRTTLQRS
ncbi:hypothetical protein ACVSQB_40880 [Bradyrhizobium elkanii]